MEHKIGLTFYKLTVHKRGEPKKRLVLNQLTKKNPDIFSCVKKYFSGLPVYQKDKLHIDNKDSKVFLEEELQENDRQIKGLLRHGEDGFSSTFFDSSSGQKSFEREPKHIELMPFYFMGDFELGKKSAILCFQTFGVYSVSGRIRSKLEDYLKSLYEPDYIVRIRVIQVGVPAISKYLKEGKVKDVTATRYFVPQDKASDNSKDIKCSMTLSPRKRGARFLPDLNQIFKKHIASEQPPNEALFKSVGEIFSIDISDYSEMEFVIDIAGVYRKIDLWDVSRSSTKFDISEKISRKPDGHPTFVSVDSMANDILDKTVRKIINK